MFIIYKFVYYMLYECNIRVLITPRNIFVLLVQLHVRWKHIFGIVNLLCIHVASFHSLEDLGRLVCWRYLLIGNVPLKRLKSILNSVSRRCEFYRILPACTNSCRLLTSVFRALFADFSTLCLNLTMEDDWGDLDDPAPMVKNAMC